MKYTIYACRNHKTLCAVSSPEDIEIFIAQGHDLVPPLVRSDGKICKSFKVNSDGTLAEDWDKIMPDGSVQKKTEQEVYMDIPPDHMPALS